MDTSFLGPDEGSGFTFGKAQPPRIVNVDKRKDTPPPPRDDVDAGPAPAARMLFAAAGKKQSWNGSANANPERMRVDVSRVGVWLCGNVVLLTPCPCDAGHRHSRRFSHLFRHESTHRRSTESNEHDQSHQSGRLPPV